MKDNAQTRWKLRNPERAKQIQRDCSKAWYAKNKGISVVRAKEWSEAYPERRKEIARAYAKKHSERIRTHVAKRKRRAVELLGGKCVDCDGVFPDCVMDFHHVDPSKKDHVPAVVLRMKWETAVAELAKCVLLCSNCHRKRHFLGSCPIQTRPSI